MCGRFTQTRPLEDLIERFAVLKAAGARDVQPSYNIAPGQDAALVIAFRERMLKRMRWGLVPSWSKTAKTEFTMINARAETLADKKVYSQLLPHKRCLVPSDGFYEWKKGGGRGRPPHRFVVDSGETYAYAGLWDEWAASDGSELFTFVIVTTEANDCVRPIHDRMPVILRREDEEAWLDPDNRSWASLLALLKPFPAERMRAYPVSARVNSPQVNDPGCIAETLPPIPPSEPQLELF